MMLDNKDVRKLLLSLTLCVIFFICIFFIGTKAIEEDYNKALINNNAYIINGIITKYPGLQDDIIDLIVHNKGLEEGTILLEKYGIDEDTIMYHGNHDTLKKNLWIYNISVFLLGVIAILVIIIVFLWKHYKRIHHIGTYMTRILNDDYSIDIRDYEEGDLSNLKNDIYKVTIKLKEKSEILYQDKKYLEETLSDISHQLKTPLTSMYVITDILETEKSAKTRKEFLEKNRLQLERIEWLVTSLLKISRLDSGTEKLKKESVSVEELIHRAISPIAIPIEQKNITLTLNVTDYPLHIDLHWTVEALVNIIKNAMEHTNEEGSITISAIDNPLYSEIIIEDTGEGISKKDLPHIFERFYKGSSNNKESIGIGLNMAKKIINLEDGEIEVSSEKGVGTTFHIKFYKRNI